MKRMILLLLLASCTLSACSTEKSIAETSVKTAPENRPDSEDALPECPVQTPLNPEKET